MTNRTLRILVFGAHPDDCDAAAGGVAVMYARRGHVVRFVALTNGDAGHYAMGGVQLAQRRQAEAQAAGHVAGVEYLVMGNHDGELLPDLDNRRLVITMMREFQPDLVLAHRADEYHPDHRAVGVLVMDASYLIGVPNIHPLVPHLQRAPVIAHFATQYGKAASVDAHTVAVDIGEAIEAKLDMLHCHTSQVYEWLPYNMGILEQVPGDEATRRKWLGASRFNGQGSAKRYRTHLAARYGAERTATIEFAEAFEVSQYGAPLTEEGRQRLFPF